MSTELLEYLPNWSWFIIFPGLSLLTLVLLTAIFRTFSEHFGTQDFDGAILNEVTPTIMSGAYMVLSFGIGNGYSERHRQ